MRTRDGLELNLTFYGNNRTLIVNNVEKCIAFIPRRVEHMMHFSPLIGVFVYF